MNKKCYRCKKIKSVENFYKNSNLSDGYFGKCKLCYRNDVKENYRKNIDHYINYEKERFKNPERKEDTVQYRETEG